MKSLHLNEPMTSMSEVEQPIDLCKIRPIGRLNESWSPMRAELKRSAQVHMSSFIQCNMLKTSNRTELN